jgi:hypothetical protein
MRSSVLTVARLCGVHLPLGGFRFRCAMVTTTYRPGVEWNPDHIPAFFHRLRSWASRRGVTVPYVWVAELQARGAVHYHILVWLPKGLTLPKPDKRGWWPHGLTRVEWARRPVGYLAKYTSKGGRSGSPAGDSSPQSQHAFPRGLRLHGFGQVPARVREIRAWWMLPATLRDQWSSADRLRRAPGGGWIATSSGEWIPPEWGLMGAASGFVRLVRLTDLQRELRALQSSYRALPRAGEACGAPSRVGG